MPLDAAKFLASWITFISLLYRFNLELTLAFELSISSKISFLSLGDFPPPAEEEVEVGG